MRVFICCLALFLIVGCTKRTSSVNVTKYEVTNHYDATYTQDHLWDAAVQSFSLDQMGVRGRLGLVPQREHVALRDAKSDARKMPTSWYEADDATRIINTQWLDISPAKADRYCDCPEIEGRGMTSTSVQLTVVVRPTPQGGSALDVTTSFRRYQDDPQNPGQGRSVFCHTEKRLEDELVDLIMERAENLE